MVETGGLENRCTGNRTGGSNPSPSAIIFVIWHLRVGDTYTDIGSSSRLLGTHLWMAAGAYSQIAEPSVQNPC